MHAKVLRSDVTAVLSLALSLDDKVDRIIIGLLDFAAISRSTAASYDHA